MAGNGPLGCDTETTGLDIYSAGYRVRTVQFGDKAESWVIPVEKDPRWSALVADVLSFGFRPLIFQHAAFDLQVIDRHLKVPMVGLWPLVTDTKILAHLVDPRGKKEGGTGHKLEELTAAYIDEQVATEVKGSMAVIAKRYKVSKDRIWSVVDIDDPEYLLYAGMDPILAIRLLEKLAPLVPESARGLVRYEHRIAEICAEMAKTGFLLDMEYTRGLSGKFQSEQEMFEAVAARLGCDNVNSTDQVAAALMARGIKIKGRTEGGKYKVDEALLGPLADSGDELAVAVMGAKKAIKWRKTWTDKFLAGGDGDNRVHASINPLAARTARMSITGIPAQTLPSGDWIIRRCFIAEPEFSVVSVDYKAQELRVLAALSGDRAMRNVFRGDGQIHLATARSVYRKEVVKDSLEYDVGKMTNFLTVYGGGPAALAEKTGLTFPQAKRVIEAFERAYPGVTKYAAKLAAEAAQSGYITTATGRRLPVDPRKPYAALNFMIQGTSRDVTCMGLISLHEAGFTPYLRFPVHDEVIASVPTAQAEWGAKEIARLMAMEFRGVFIDTDADIYGPSWGHGYMNK